MASARARVLRVLALVAFGALPPLALIVNVFRRYAREAFRAIRARIALLNAYVAEQVQGVAVVQAFGREAECAREYAEINDAYRRANHQAIRYDALLFSVVESVSAVTIALILWYAAVRLGGLPEASTGAWVGTVVAFYEYIQRFFDNIRQYLSRWFHFSHVVNALASSFSHQILALIVQRSLDVV